MSAHNADKIERLTQNLKLLANPNRLRILTRLLDGEMSVGAIEQELAIRQPSLSRELSNLRDGGAITARRESKVVFYALTSGEIEDLLRRVLGLASDQSANVSLVKPTARPDFDARPKFRFYSNSKAAPQPAQNQPQNL